MAISLPHEGKNEAWIKHEDQYWYFEWPEGQREAVGRWCTTSSQRPGSRKGLRMFAPATRVPSPVGPDSFENSPVPQPASKPAPARADALMKARRVQPFFDADFFFVLFDMAPLLSLVKLPCSF